MNRLNINHFCCPPAGFAAGWGLIYKTGGGYNPDARTHRANSPLCSSNLTFIAEDSMKVTYGKALPIIAVAGTLALGACASQGDVDDLRRDVNQLKSDVAKLQSDVTAARTESARAAQQAQAAATEARNAAAAANAAAERADRMFQKGLRK